MKKTLDIFINAIPVLVMIALIPLVANDYTLSLAYIVITISSLLFKKEKNDILIFVFGFCIMIASEYLFIATGVEIFKRNSLLGLMPLWLPFLWGYGFVAIKRAVVILDR